MCTTLFLPGPELEKDESDPIPGLKLLTNTVCMGGLPLSSSQQTCTQDLTYAGTVLRVLGASNVSYKKTAHCLCKGLYILEITAPGEVGAGGERGARWEKEAG